MIELKAKSENYIPKEEIEKLIESLGSTESREPEVVLAELLDKDFEVAIEVEVDDTLSAALR